MKKHYLLLIALCFGLFSVCEGPQEEQGSQGLQGK